MTNETKKHLIVLAFIVFMALIGAVLPGCSKEVLKQAPTLKQGSVPLSSLTCSCNGNSISNDGYKLKWEWRINN